MNIFKRELKANLKAFSIWFISLALLYYAASNEYSVFTNNPDISEALNNPTFQVFFQALGVNTIDIMTPEGYLSLMSFYIYLPLAIYASMLGSSIISKEEKDKTAEYLFTLPVTRNKVLVQKLLLAFLYTTVLNILLMLSAYYFFGNIGHSDAFKPFMINLTIGVLLTQYIFLSIGFLLSSILKEYKKSGAISLAILLFTFMLSMLTQITDKIDFLKVITPFQYFNVNHMLEGVFPLSSIILSIVIILSSISGLFYFYNRRDLYL